MTAKEQDIETSLSLLNKNSSKSEKSTCQSRTKRVLCGLLTTLVIVALLIGAAAFLCFADITKPLRCAFSNAATLDLTECETEHVLDSWSNGVDAEDIASINETYSEIVKPCEGVHANDTECGKQVVKQLTTQDLEYIALAESTWDISWEIFHDDNGWSLEKGSSIKSGKVYSKNYKGMGKVSKLQGYVDISCEGLFNLLITDTAGQLTWNPALSDIGLIYTVTQNTDIVYVATKPTGGGLISARDFVNLRHWETRDGVTLCSEISTTHPDAPSDGDVVRVTNKPSGILFRPVSGKPNQCLLERSLCADIGGWIPQWTVDAAVAGSLMDFYDDLQDKVNQINQ